MLALLIGYKSLVRGQNWIPNGGKARVGNLRRLDLKAQAPNVAIARPRLTHVFAATGALANADVSAAPTIGVIFSILARRDGGTPVDLLPTIVGH